MKPLLDAIAELVRLISPEKVEAIAGRLRGVGVEKASAALSGVVGTPVASLSMNRLIDAWKSTSIGSSELSSMLLAAAHTLKKSVDQESIELVWTGPTTPVVATRRTEQALLQVINSAQRTLFITSFVAYDVQTIVEALNSAAGRQVGISILLESSIEHGGSISIDALTKMRTLVPRAELYAWREKTEPFSDGRVHAKIAVSDANLCFITSANLTGYAMERNMEAGVLISGGHVPRLLDAHLHALVIMKIVMRV